jgi:hypothetical protein
VRLLEGFVCAGELAAVAPHSKPAMILITWIMAHAATKMTTAREVLERFIC